MEKEILNILNSFDSEWDEEEVIEEEEDDPIDFSDDEEGSRTI